MTTTRLSVLNPRHQRWWPWRPLATGVDELAEGDPCVSLSQHAKTKPPPLSHDWKIRKAIEIEQVRAMWTFYSVSLSGECQEYACVGVLVCTAKLMMPEPGATWLQSLEPLTDTTTNGSTTTQRAAAQLGKCVDACDRPRSGSACPSTQRCRHGTDSFTLHPSQKSEKNGSFKNIKI